MDALLMCGGTGTRLDVDVEKPLFAVGGRPMVDRVRDALVASRAETVHAVGSPATPRTVAHVPGPTIEAPGAGYVSDLQYALERVDPPVLTVAADLPLLAGEAVDAVLDRYDLVLGRHDAGSLSVSVPAALKRQLGVTVDTTTTANSTNCVEAKTRGGGPADDRLQPDADHELAPTGLNVMADADDESTHVTWDARLAVNVNRLADARVAEAML